jgi:hypothetical protein
MRKIFGGVTTHPVEIKEWYFVAVKQEDDTYETLHKEPFDRKKVYGKDFVVAIAKTALPAAGHGELTEQEEAWYQAAENTELQTEIISAAQQIQY